MKRTNVKDIVAQAQQLTKLLLKASDPEGQEQEGDEGQEKEGEGQPPQEGEGQPPQEGEGQPSVADQVAQMVSQASDDELSQIMQAIQAEMQKRQSAASNPPPAQSGAPAGAPSPDMVKSIVSVLKELGYAPQPIQPTKKVVQAKGRQSEVTENKQKPSMKKSDVLNLLLNKKRQSNSQAERAQLHKSIVAAQNASTDEEAVEVARRLGIDVK